MTRTAEERAEISRRNGSRSGGPKTEEGKARSRANALKHGLRAEALALPGEDPAFAAGRAREWNDYYRPGSPMAKHLVNECVRATLLSDRVDALQAASAAAQFRKVKDEWDAEQGGRLDEQLQRLGETPGLALAELRTFAAGCRWLIGQWEAIDGRRAASGALHPDDLTNAGLMLGGRRGDGDGDGAAHELFQLSMALDHRRSPRGPNAPDPATARALLDLLIASELAALNAEEAGLTAADETPALAQAAALALIPVEESTARLFLRYQAEARTSFHRAAAALVKTLDRDRAEGEQAAADGRQDAVATPSPNEPTEAAGDAPPNEPDATAARPGGGISPNEPTAPPSETVGPFERKGGGGMAASRGGSAGRAA